MQNQLAPITKKFRILVIERNKEAAALLLAKLGRIGAISYPATDGRSGILAFKQVKPHLLLINPNLPDLDGFQLCADLRHVSHTPIVLAADPYSTAIQVKGIKCGADRCISQNIEMPLLRAEISSLLRRAYWYDRKRLPFTEFAERSISSPSSDGSHMEKILVQDDWITCDSCGYMGPSARFVNPVAIQKTYTCPHCMQQESLIFTI